MLEKLLELKVAYERAVASAHTPAPAPGTFDALIRDAFPDLLRAFTETIEENRQLRGLAASALVKASPNATPLEFAGYSDPFTGDVFDSLSELAAARGVVASEAVIAEEHYARLIHFDIHGGPTSEEPLRRFEFSTRTRSDQADPGNSAEPALGR